MKVQCDACEKKEASVFCSADEAALCGSCDQRVHHANKLAGKHIRFCLLNPSLKEFPRCDICQERRAFLFCQEDRAILCRECDIPIHKANEHTQKHNRFLLTGVKLSPPFSSSSSYPASSSSNGSDLATEPEIKSSVSNQFCNSNSTEKKSLPSTSTSSRADDNYQKCVSQECSVSTSSISEYLMETLPGWRVDDLLDPSCFPHGFCKSDDHEFVLSGRGFGSDLYSLLADSATRVPDQSQPLTSVIDFGLQKSSEEAQKLMKIGRKWSDYGPTDPRISLSLKRSGHFL